MRLSSNRLMETSPHTRGELISSALSIDLFGNIPAYAGRTAAKRSWRRNFKKHPRIRGENPNRLVWDNWQKETSPHTRGELIWFAVVGTVVRNIPAYAGRTEQRRRKSPNREKHPRIRGENQTASMASLSLLETSPHTRGEHSVFNPQYLLASIDSF